jgi:hypothetical protein
MSKHYVGCYVDLILLFKTLSLSLVLKCVLCNLENAEVPVSQEAHAGEGGRGSELDPEAADVFRYREEARLERVDRADHWLPSATATTCFSFRPTAPCLGPSIPNGTLADVVSTSRPSHACSTLGSSSAAV